MFYFNVLLLLESALCQGQQTSNHQTNERSLELGNVDSGEESTFTSLSNEQTQPVEYGKQKSLAHEKLLVNIEKLFHIHHEEIDNADFSAQNEILTRKRRNSNDRHRARRIPDLIYYTSYEYIDPSEEDERSPNRRRYDRHGLEEVKIIEEHGPRRPSRPDLDRDEDVVFSIVLDEPDYRDNPPINGKQAKWKLRKKTLKGKKSIRKKDPRFDDVFGLIVDNEMKYFRRKRVNPEIEMLNQDERLKDSIKKDRQGRDEILVEEIGRRKALKGRQNQNEPKYKNESRKRIGNGHIYKQIKQIRQNQNVAKTLDREGKNNNSHILIQEGQNHKDINNKESKEVRIENKDKKQLHKMTKQNETITEDSKKQQTGNEDKLGQVKEMPNQNATTFADSIPVNGNQGNNGQIKQITTNQNQTKNVDNKEQLVGNQKNHGYVKHTNQNQTDKNHTLVIGNQDNNGQLNQATIQNKTRDAKTEQPNKTKNETELMLKTENHSTTIKDSKTEGVNMENKNKTKNESKTGQEVKDKAKTVGKPFMPPQKYTGTQLFYPGMGGRSANDENIYVLSSRTWASV